jgi:two-component system alkaline phosphatase synthesis response regulator PhoP
MWSMWKKPKILIIDDEKDFCYFLKFNFEAIKKYKVFIATNGKDGVETAIRKKPDLILLDIMMPRIDGFEVLKSLKENIETTAIPIIMLTALDQDKLKMKANELYSSDYFTKTIETETLIAGIDKVLSTQRRL